VAPPPFPGGVALRGPLHVLGMLWYALRDRLDQLRSWAADRTVKAD